MGAAATSDAASATGAASWSGGAPATGPAASADVVAGGGVESAARADAGSGAHSAPDAPNVDVEPTAAPFAGSGSAASGPGVEESSSFSALSEFSAMLARFDDSPALELPGPSMAPLRPEPVEAGALPEPEPTPRAERSATAQPFAPETVFGASEKPGGESRAARSWGARSWARGPVGRLVRRRSRRRSLRRNLRRGRSGKVARGCGLRLRRLVLRLSWVGPLTPTLSRMWPVLRGGRGAGGGGRRSWGTCSLRLCGPTKTFATRTRRRIRSHMPPSRASWALPNSAVGSARAPSRWGLSIRRLGGRGRLLGRSGWRGTGVATTLVTRGDRQGRTGIPRPAD